MTVGTGVVSGFRVSHDEATLDDIEAASTDHRSTVRRLIDAPDVSEGFALQTCNRFEAYVVTDEAATGRDALADVSPGVDAASVVEMGHEESLRHLLRVATGLESLVLGEDQIIGQVRDAYADAKAVGGIGPVLEDAVTKAIHVGERARSETAINEGVVSIPSAAVSLAAEHRNLTGDTALVVGAGEMGELAANAFADAGVEHLVIANRSLDRAERVAANVDHDRTRAVELAELPSRLADSDVVVSATGSEDYVLDAGVLDDSGETFVVDIAQPRDVSPTAAALGDVTVRDLDALEAVTRETKRRRRGAAESVEAMVDREFDRLQEQYKRKRADEVIGAMYESADRIKARELRTALSRLDACGEFTDEQREIVESLADALVSQLLAAPTKSLRDAAANDDWTTINTALQLFDPEFGDGEPPEFVREMLPADAEEIPSDVAAGLDD